MNKQQDFDTTIRIPVVTDLVSPGDPDIISRAKSGETTENQQNFEKRLKERIAELQTAAGQDEYTGLARAHAIRSEQPEPESAETGLPDTSGTTVTLRKDYEQQIDERRNELIRELSGMLK
ncbi:MAG: hypothetical protein CSA79_02755 [Thiothrix nivea]|nr:MAG: hypothetical protein CSA79_02755 [Thiothrix nivea]